MRQNPHSRLVLALKPRRKEGFITRKRQVLGHDLYDRLYRSETLIRLHKQYYSMKLKIDLVPSTAWYSNLRTKIPKEEWDKIRKQSYADANHKCAICGTKAELNCHEIWDYDDKKHIQKLKGFIALCDNCHFIKHLGLSGILNIDRNMLIEHFMRVNRVNRKTFDKHYEEAFRIHRERSEHEWKTDFGQWSSLIIP